MGLCAYFAGSHRVDSSLLFRQKPRSVSAEENSALTEVKDYVNEMYILEEKLADKIDSLPMQGAYINALDQVNVVSYH